MNTWAIRATSWLTVPLLAPRAGRGHGKIHFLQTCASFRFPPGKNMYFPLWLTLSARSSSHKWESSLSCVTFYLLPCGCISCCSKCVHIPAAVASPGRLLRCTSLGPTETRQVRLHFSKPRASPVHTAVREAWSIEFIHSRANGQEW